MGRGGALRGVPALLGAAAMLWTIGAPPAAAFDFRRTLRAQADQDAIVRGQRLGDFTARTAGELALGDSYADVALQWIRNDSAGFEDTTTALTGAVGTLRSLGARGELDLGLSATVNLSEESALRLDDRVELYAGFIANLPLSPAAYGYYDAKNEAFTVQAGVYERVDLPFLLALRGAADIGHVSGEDVDAFLYAQGRADLVRSFLGGLEAYVGVRASSLNEELVVARFRDGRGPETDEADVWAGGGVSWSF